MQAVDVVGQAGRPKTITGFQTHTTPVLLGHGERAELATDECTAWRRTPLIVMCVSKLLTLLGHWQFDCDGRPHRYSLVQSAGRARHPSKEPRLRAGGRARAKIGYRAPVFAA